MFLLILWLLDICHRPLFAFLQVHLFSFMSAYGHHFHTQYVDEGHITQYFAVEVVFYQYICVSFPDENLIEGKLGYIGKIKEIMQVDFSSF
jgi:hypothetical protein